MTALLLLLLAAQDTGINLPVEEYGLENGMKVLVVPRHDTPRVYCALYWKVGSVNERPGITGLSHFFEHMMFKGTATIGTTDAKRDAEINAEIDETMGRVREVQLIYREYERRGAKPNIEEQVRLSERMKKLTARYEALVAEQKKITVSEHISKLYMGNGGTGLNASTYYDWTRYFVELPANKVELFFWLESDRFLRPVFREFYPERDVVKEERRMRYEATPTGLIGQAFGAMFWQAHPYGWPVIGWMSDIEMYTLADAMEYFRVYYSPHRCTAVFVGDVQATQIRDLAQRYFGRIPRGKDEPPAIVTREPEQIAEARMHAEAPAQPFLTIRWHAPGAVHAETPALDLAMMVLDGQSGRLHRALVEEKKLALMAGSSYYVLRYGGMADIDARPRPGVAMEDLEKAMIEVVEKLRKEGVTERELQKVKNQSVASTARQLQTNSGIGNALGLAEISGNWRDVKGYLDKVMAVTPDQVREAAAKHMTPQGRNVLVVKRKEKR
ncbi:MAG: insulinase family protein [Planctomycetes bacterium]|nr:insulinase family protein [Planctomycetota bacterium]